MEQIKILQYSLWYQNCQSEEKIFFLSPQKQVLQGTTLYFLSAQKIFEFGNKAGKLLPYFTKPDFNPTVVSSLLTYTGQKVTAHTDTLQMFIDLYSSLYRSTVSYEAEVLESFLDTVQFPQLWKTDRCWRPHWLWMN